MKAGVLLDLEDPSNGTTSYSFTLTATANTMDISFSGYNLPSFNGVTSIELTSGGPNLLGTTWAFTPAPSGSESFQTGPGAFGTNNISFGGVTEDSYDMYKQTVGTTVGQTYTLDFNLSISQSPSGTIVEATNVQSSATPEPATGLLFLGAGLSVLVARKRLARS